MPTAEPPREPRPKKRRRCRNAWLPSTAPRTSAILNDLFDKVISTGDVRDRVKRELCTGPTARLELAIQGLDPSDPSKGAFRAHPLGEEQYYAGAIEQKGDVQAVTVLPQIDKVRSKPALADSFVTCLHETYTLEGEGAALDYVYAVFHPLVIKDHEFDRVGRILSQVNVSDLSSSILVGLLMTTYAHKTNLGTRSDFFAKVKARIGQLPDGAELSPYLADLE